MGKKITALFLTVALICALFSCKEETKETQPETSDTSLATEAETEEKIDYYKNVPKDTDYGGYKFTVLEYDNEVYWLTYIGTSEQTGEVLNDAAYRRNLEVSELLGIEIEMIRKPIWSILDTMKKSNAANDNIYDLVVPWPVENLAKTISENQVYDWKKIPYVDLKADWYSQSANDVLTVKGKQYFAVSNLTYPLHHHFRILFNKDLFSEMGLEYPYQLVYDGKWTYDAFYRLVHGAYSDLNGNGSADTSDRYGLGTNIIRLSYSICNWGEYPVNLDKNGFTLNIYSDKIADMVSKLVELVSSKDTYAQDDDYAYSIFWDGRALFTPYSSSPELLRDIEFDFGYLPYPKYDEAQKDYITVGFNGYMGVPITKTDDELERIGAIIEALSAASSKYVEDAFITKYIEGKVLRDADSVNMYRLCRSTETHSRAFIFDSTGIIRDMNYYSEIIRDKSGNLASQYEKYNAKIEKALQKMYESITGD